MRCRMAPCRASSFDESDTGVSGSVRHVEFEQWETGTNGTALITLRHEPRRNFFWNAAREAASSQLERSFPKKCSSGLVAPWNFVSARSNPFVPVAVLRLCPFPNAVAVAVAVVIVALKANLVR